MKAYALRSILTVIAAAVAIAGGVFVLMKGPPRAMERSGPSLERDATHQFTCAKCLSTIACADPDPQIHSQITVVSRTEAFEACLHAWRLGGISTAYPEPIPNGRVVLARKGRAVGAFIPLEQTVTPERMLFRWWYREDGQGILDSTADLVTTGTNVCFPGESNEGGIRFGPFAIGWSGCADGKGFVYFDYAHPDVVPEAALRLCVTDVTEVKGVNASDPRWDFRSTPSP